MSRPKKPTRGEERMRAAAARALLLKAVASLEHRARYDHGLLLNSALADVKTAIHLLTPEEWEAA